MEAAAGRGLRVIGKADRKSTRLNSSHLRISYAVFCLKKNTGNPLGLPRDELAFEQSETARSPDFLAKVAGTARSVIIVAGKFGRDLAALFFLKMGGPPEFSLFPLHAAFLN